MITCPEASARAITFGVLTQTLSSNTLWAARVGRFVYDLFAPPSTGVSDDARYFDCVTGVASEAPAVSAN